MFKKKADGDICNEEFNTILIIIISLLKVYVIPEVIVYYIDNSYYRNFIKSS